MLSKNVKIKIFRTIIWLVVLYGCETWPLTLREECRLRVFENRVLRRIFGSTRNEVRREWRKLHIGKLNDLYSSPNTLRVIKSRRKKSEGHIASVGERRGVYRVLVGKPSGKKPLGRPRRRWEDNIKKEKVGCGVMDWIDLSLYSISTSIGQGSWFQQSRLKIMEVLFLTYIVRRLPACTIQAAHTSAQERLLIEANFADRSCWSTSLAARRRSAVLTRLPKSKKASSVGTSTKGDTL